MSGMREAEKQRHRGEGEYTVDHCQVSTLSQEYTSGKDLLAHCLPSLQPIYKDVIFMNISACGKVESLRGQ